MLLRKFSALLSLALILQVQADPVPEKQRKRIPAMKLEKLAPGNIDENSLMPNRPEQIGLPLDLAECYHIGFEHQPVLASAQAKVVQAQARLNQQYALYAPSLGYTFSRTLNRGESINDTPLLPGSISDSSTMQFQMNQTLFDFGQRRALVEAYRESLRAALYSWQGTWVDQSQKIQQAYIEVLRAEYLLATAQSNQQRVESYTEISRRFYLGGIKSRIDVTQAEIQVAQAKVGVAQAQNQLRVSRANLAQAMGVDLRVLETRVLRDEIFEPYRLPDRVDAIGQLERNPQVEALGAQARFNQVSSEAQWKQVLPTFQGQASYGIQGVMVPNEIRVWTLGLTVNFPFYQPNIQPTAELFEATARQLEHDRRSALLVLRQQLDTAYSNVDAAQQRSDFAAEEVTSALANFRIAYKRYASGLSDITELLNARSFLLGAQNDYVNAVHDRKVAEGQLRFTQSYQPDPVIDIDGLLREE